MRVGILDLAWMSAGGNTTYRYVLGKGLDELGVHSEQIHFTRSGRPYSGSLSNKWQKTLKQPGFTTREIEFLRWKKPSVQHWMEQNLEYLNSFDLIILNGQGHYGWDAKCEKSGDEPYWMFYLRHMRTPFGVIVHDEYHRAVAKNFPFALKIQRFKNFIGQLFVGADWPESYKKKYGSAYTDRNAKMIFLPFDPDFIKGTYEDKPPVVGMTGRITGSKGNWMLAAAAPYLHESLSIKMFGRPMVWASGDGNSLVPEEMLAGEWEYPDDVERVYSQLRVALSLSKFNGAHFEYVTLEAMGQGTLPIVPVSMNMMSPNPQKAVEVPTRRKDFVPEALAGAVNELALLPESRREQIVMDNYAYLREYHDPVKYAAKWIDVWDAFTYA